MEAVTVRTFSSTDKEACLAVFDSNRPKFFSGFYERLGFTLTDIQRDGYRPGMHRCEMEWLINRAATDRGALGEAS